VGPEPHGEGHLSDRCNAPVAIGDAVLFQMTLDTLKLAYYWKSLFTNQLWYEITKTTALKVIWEEYVALAQLCNKVAIGYNWTPRIHPQNCPFPSTITTPCNAPILDQRHSSPKTASVSTQPFCHNTLSGQTDWQTDRPTDGLGEKRIPREFTLCWTW